MIPPPSTVFTKLSRPSFYDINVIRCTRIYIIVRGQPTCHQYRAKKGVNIQKFNMKILHGALCLATNNADRR
jgi:hypothetical protein